MDKKLEQTLDMLKERIKIGKASVIIIDGGVGEGKTTFAVECSDYYQGTNIDFKKQLAMGGEQFNEKLLICHENKLPVIIYDEAGDFAKRGALTKMNAMLNRIFDTFRTFKILIIIVLPNFFMLDNNLFDNNIPRLLLHCHKRNSTEGRFKAYGLKRMFFIRENMRKSIIKAQAYNKTTSNFRGKFKNIDPKRSKELDKFTTNEKATVINKQSLIMRNLTDINNISSNIGRSKAWVRQKIKKLKLKEDKIYKTKKYYDKNIIDRLKDELKY